MKYLVQAPDGKLYGYDSKDLLLVDIAWLFGLRKSVRTLKEKA